MANLILLKKIFNNSLLYNESKIYIKLIVTLNILIVFISFNYYFFLLQSNKPYITPTTFGDRDERLIINSTA
jgi:hypothetical protein